MTDDALRYRADVRLEPWSHARVVLFCGGLLMWLEGASQSETWLEEVWLPMVGRPALGWLGWGTGWVPFAIAEGAAGIGLLLLAFVVLSALSDVAAGRRRLSNALAAGALNLASGGLFALLWFQLAWGAAYARAPLADRWGLESPAPVDDPDAARLALRSRLVSVVDRVNASYRALHGVDDAGEVTGPKDGQNLDAMLERAYAALGKRWPDEPALGDPQPPAKSLVVSDVFGWLGLGGVFVPFTGEAVVNGGPPGWAVVMTTAHEKAHQRFIAQEDEATFVGVLAGLSSRDPLLRYGAWMTVRSQLSRTLAKVDRPAVDEISGRLLPGVQRDLEAHRAYWARYAGPVEQVARSVNDTYLKAHGVSDGVVAYSRAAQLLDAWLQTTEGRRALSGRSVRP